MSGKKIHELIEDNGVWSYPQSFLPGAFRLVEVKPLLSKRRSRIVLYEFPHLDLFQPTISSSDGTTARVPSYVAISHVWKPSPAVANRPNSRPLQIDLGDGKTHEIGWVGLMQAAIAARHWRCKYIWLDFVCLNQTSDDDKALQIKNMANIYAYCSYALVMLGGVRCAQRLEDESRWHTRAWTLQEAVESFRRGRNAVRYTLFEWGYDSSFEVYRRGFQLLGGGLAIVPVQELLDLQGAGMPIAKVKRASKYSPTIAGEPILVPVNSFGKNKAAVIALLRLLHHLPKIGQESWWDPSVWCALWIRTSSREHDLLYSAMNLFTTHVTIPINYTEDFEVTLARFLAIIHEKPKVPYWLSISHRAPMYEWSGLLPRRPEFTRHELPTYTIGEAEPVDAQEFICDTGCCGGLDWCVHVTGASKETGHTLCAKVLKLVCVATTSTLPTYTEQHWQHVRKILISYRLAEDGSTLGIEENWTFEADAGADVEMVDTYPLFNKDEAVLNKYDIVTGHPVEPKHNKRERWIRSRTDGADLVPLQRQHSTEPGSVDLTGLCWLDGRLGPYLAILGFYNSHYQNPVVYFFDRTGEGGTVHRVGTGKLLLSEKDRIRDDIPWMHIRVGGSIAGPVSLEHCTCEDKEVVPSIEIVSDEEWWSEWMH